MSTIHLILGVVVTALLALAGGLGAWRWYRVETSQLFWPLLRVGQAALVLQVALGGALLLADRRPADDLHYVYGLLPLVVSYLGEQLRISAAQAVLDARGHGSAAAVGELPADQQRSVVVAILRREIGVMALAALAAAGLCLRAGFTSSAL